MKKSSEVLGLTMIGIKEGTENGIAQDFMIDAASKLVKYLILKSASGYGFKVMKVTDIQGIGADYIMAPSVNNAVNIYESKNLMEEIEKGFFILGATVLSSNGDIIGVVTDFTFDKNTGQMGEIILDNGSEYNADKIATLAGKMVFIDTDGTIAKKLESIPDEVYLPEDVPVAVAEEPADIPVHESPAVMEAEQFTEPVEEQIIVPPEPAIVIPEPEITIPEPEIVIPEPEIVVPEPEIVMPEPEPVIVTEPESIAVPAPKVIVPEPEQIIVPEPVTVPKSNGTIEAESMAYLLNKVVKSDVVSDDGLFSVEAGTVLTQEIITMADQHDAILNLTLSV